jgi:hypothetical protein
VVASQGSREITILLNNGDGTFSNSRAFPVPSSVGEVRIGDLDGVNGQDVVAALFNRDPLIPDIAIFFNQGKGTFGAPVSFEVASDAQGLRVADMDGDADLDIVIASSDSDEVIILTNQGNGVFDPPLGVILSETRYLDVGDLDNDGDNDIATARAPGGGTLITLVRNDGGGVYTGVGVGTESIRSSYPIIVDLNGDGINDISTFETSPGAVSVRIGKGNLQFDVVEIYPTASLTRLQQVADLNLDGRPDVIATLSGFVPGIGNGMTVHLNPGNGTLPVSFIHPTTAIGLQLAAADFDGDGDIDIASADQALSTVSLHRNRLIPLTISSATLLENAPGNGIGDPGEQMALGFDLPIVIAGEPVTINAFDFVLTTGSLGSDSTLSVNPLNPREALITIGSTASGLDASTLGIDIAGAATTGLIVDAVTGNDAEDSGVVGVDDRTLSVVSAVGEHTVNIDPTLGGTASVSSDEETYQFTRHQLIIPPSALDGAPLDITMGPPLDAPAALFDLPSAVAITNSRGPNLVFSSPVTLELQYDPDSAPRDWGAPERVFRAVQIGLPPSGGAAQGPSMGNVEFFDQSDVTFDTESNTMKIQIDSLDPLSTGGMPGTFATLPVNPVEERTIFLAAGSGGAALTVGDPALTPGTAGGSADSLYALHRVEFPGFTEVGGPGAGVTQVTMRTATLFDRTAFLGQSFPLPSGALFVVETRNDSGVLTPFMAPVNLEVMFLDTGEMMPSQSDFNDLVDFDGNVGVDFQMRLVHDIDATVNSNFAFYTGPGSDDQMVGGGGGPIPLGGVIAQPGILRVEGVTNLTGSNGLGSWGVVADTSLTAGFDQLIAHILGEITLGGAAFLSLDGNMDGDLDAADVVDHVNESP